MKVLPKQARRKIFDETSFRTMDVGAKLSKGRPKYRSVKTVDFGDFGDFGVNAGLCVGRVFITKKDHVNGFKFS